MWFLFLALASFAFEPLASNGVSAHECLDLPPRMLFAGHDRVETVSLSGGETKETIWLQPRRSFREVLPSWNITTPAGAGFVVELQVGAGEEVSPWMHIGDWQGDLAGTSLLPPKEARTVKVPGGRVAVDIYKAERPLDRARLRVRALGKGALEVRRMAVVFSDMERFEAPGRSSAVKAGVLTGRALEAAFGGPLAARRQGAEREEIAGRICSPTSVAMVIGDLAQEGAPTTEAVARLAYDPAHDIYGNWNRAVQAAWSCGVPGRLERFDRWEQVASLLAAGRRLVISLASEEGDLRGAPYARTSGHLLVLWGLTADGAVLVHDPAAHRLEEVPRLYLPQDLEQVWMKRGGVGYAFDPR